MILDNKYLNIDLFDRYLRHELTEAEQQEFNENLLNDNAFNSAFIEYKTIALGIRDYGKAGLKDYLKKNVRTHTPTISPFLKTIYAMAAVLVLFAGLYIIFQYNSGNEKAPQISTTNEVKKEAVQAAPPAIAQNAEPEQKMDAIETPPSEYKAEKNVTTTPIISKNLAEKTEDLDMAAGADAAPVVEAKDDDDYKVVSDKKVGDTVLFALNISEKDKLVSSNVSVTKEKTSRKAIPSANNESLNYKKKNEKGNNGYAATDSASLDHVDEADKYLVEFWQSPVNFKGYKFNNKSLMLYGLPNRNISLTNYNNKLYMSNGSNVYIMNICLDGCAYKNELDETIINLILNK